MEDRKHFLQRQRGSGYAFKVSQDAEFREVHDDYNAPNMIFNGAFLAGAVKCTFTPLGQQRYRFKCADRDDYQIYIISDYYTVDSIEINGEKVVEVASFFLSMTMIISSSLILPTNKLSSNVFRKQAKVVAKMQER
jgi:hypothetical protein